LVGDGTSPIKSLLDVAQKSVTKYCTEFKKDFSFNGISMSIPESKKARFYIPQNIIIPK